MVCGKPDDTVSKGLRRFQCFDALYMLSVEFLRCSTFRVFDENGALTSKQSDMSGNCYFEKQTSGDKPKRGAVHLEQVQK